MRYLGLDLGSKTLGIAISDKTNTIASIYKTIRFDENEYDSVYEEVLEIIEKENITTIILGLPKNMNNTIGSRAEITMEFKEKLENISKIPIIFEDERLTSVISNKILINADVRREKRKKVVDNMAAVLILQNYLDKERR